MSSVHCSGKPVGVGQLQDIPLGSSQLRNLRLFVGESEGEEYSAIHTISFKTHLMYLL